jgi:rhamnosyltransferase
MPEFLGLVVLFHPDEGVVERVRSYIADLSSLLVIDNSVPPSPMMQELKALDPKVIAIVNDSNLGIARALNQGTEYGAAHGFDWLLTMDQDSHFRPGAIGIMKDYLSTVKTTPGILAPFHHTPGARLPQFHGLTKNLRITMTSGNLLNLHAAARCGPFEEKLFIDSVDHDYCLRLRKLGFQIIRLNTAILEHSLGNIRYSNLLGFRIKTSNHSAPRRYYMTRNRLFVMSRHLFFDIKFFWRELLELIKSFYAVLFFEKNKSEKLRAMGTGAWHYLIGRYGKTYKI